MTVSLSSAKYHEHTGRDSIDRAALWQGNAGTIYALNCVYAACGAAIATTTTQAKTVATTPYTVGGKLFSKAATDNLWTLGVAGSNTLVPANSWQKYALLIDDAGVATVQEATPSSVSAAAVTWQNVTAMAKAYPQNPWAPIIAMLNASRAIFSVLTITTAGSSFTPGTTALTGIATFADGIDASLMPLIANVKGLLFGLNL